MHLIHVWIVASAVPPPSSVSGQRTKPLQRREDGAFCDAGMVQKPEKTGPIGRPLPLFASHA
jgi:hypothetical protein